MGRLIPDIAFVIGNLVFTQQGPIFRLKTALCMMFFLMDDIIGYNGDFSLSYGKYPIPILPGEIPQLGITASTPQRGGSFQIANQISQSDRSGENQQKMHMILHPAYAKGLPVLIYHAAEVTVHFLPQCEVVEQWAFVPWSKKSNAPGHCSMTAA